MDGYRTAEPGEQVEFEEEASERGPRAKSVKKVD
jgi:cold shock CspA family protein